METLILVPDFTKTLLNLGFPQETPGFHLQVAILKLKASDCPTHVSHGNDGGVAPFFQKESKGSVPDFFMVFPLKHRE